MPYQLPETSENGTDLALTCIYGNTEVVGIHVSITVEGSAVATDGDAALQALVDALHSNPAFRNMNAVQTITEMQMRQMTPSA